jgi:hypothetical protein
MKQLSPRKKIKLLSRLSWDSEVSPEHLYRLLQHETDHAGNMDIRNLYYRILTTFDWYTVLQLVPRNNLKELLDDSVLNRIYPIDLKSKFIFARTILLGEIIFDSRNPSYGHFLWEPQFTCHLKI